MGCVFGRQQQHVNNASPVDAAENNVRVVVTTTTTTSFAVTGVGDGGAVDVRNCDGGEDSSRVVVERRRVSKRNKTKLNPRLSNIPKHVHGEQVAAGWPSWLSAVAGEAINGWIPRRADIFEKLDKATFDCLLKTYGFLTPDFWENTNFIKSPYQQHTDLLAKPTSKVVITEVTETADA